MYHRVCLKLASMGPDPADNVPKPFKRKDLSRQVSVETAGVKKLKQGDHSNQVGVMIIESSCNGLV